MNKFFTALIAGSLLIMSSVHAEIMTVTGSDDYVMSEFETIDIAKQRAKQKALRAAQEKAGVFVQSNTDVVNMMVTNDEIHTLTAGILNVSDVQYSQKALPNVNGFVIHATVTALVDTDDIDNWLNLCYIFQQERRIYHMAEYQLSGDVKKGIKVKYTDPFDISGSRTYNGLNVNTNSTLQAGAINGVYIGVAAGIFDSLFSGATQNTNIGVIYNTEESLEVTGNG